MEKRFEFCCSNIFCVYLDVCLDNYYSKCSNNKHFQIFTVCSLKKFDNLQISTMEKSLFWNIFLSCSPNIYCKNFALLLPHSILALAFDIFAK